MQHRNKQAIIAIGLILITQLLLSSCGSHQKAKSATGNITFFNSSLNTFTVASGTTFQVGKVQILTDKTAVIPPATPLQVGQITVPAHAVPPGAAGNIPALAINQTCCNSNGSILAKNQNAFTGGQDAT